MRSIAVISVTNIEGNGFQHNGGGSYCHLVSEGDGYQLSFCMLKRVEKNGSRRKCKIEEKIREGRLRHKK